MKLPLIPSRQGRLGTIAWLPLLSLALLAMTFSPQTAKAYTTRAHMVFANEIRASLIASGDGTIAMRWSGYTTRIPMADAEAIIAQPLAFRAGAIGPDNFVFPAMTDGTHGIEGNPYLQCEFLYNDAVTEAEKAYALGCFLHGATDAVVHHFVNYFTGETFSLTPITASRESAWDNVVGHIVTESIIQSAIYEADNTAMSASNLEHTIPRDFVLRNYHNVDAPLWRLMARASLERLESAQSANPDADLLTQVNEAGLAQFEQIVLVPYYIDQMQTARAGLRDLITSEIADMQDHSSTRGAELLVEAGGDMALGTDDDVTDCTAGCPELYLTYLVYINLLQPRISAGGTELPSAFDTVSDDLGAKLNQFPPALVETIEGISATINTPVTDDLDHGLDITEADITRLLVPMEDWLTMMENIDYNVISMSLTPTWYQRITEIAGNVGISISIGATIEAFIGPVIREIRETIRERVIAEARLYLTDLTRNYQAMLEAWRARVNDGLDASTPTGRSGHALTTLHDSGLWAHSLNLVAATFANHEVLVNVDTDDTHEAIGNSPASFDASYTGSWTQAGLCDYLSTAIFPGGGPNMRALLSVNEGSVLDTAGVLAANIDDNAPVECHDGSLMAFGTPNTTTCAQTDLEALLSTPHQGSLSRAYPPEFAAGSPTCARMTVPGLPEPPPLPDAGPNSVDGGTTGDSDGSISNVDGGPDTGGGGDTCGCSVPGQGSDGSPFALMLGLLGLVGLRRRRSRLSAKHARMIAPVLAAGLLLSGCPTDVDTTLDSGPDSGSSPVDAGDFDGGDEDAGIDTTLDSGVDGGIPVGTDAGPDNRTPLLELLTETVWHRNQTRIEGATEVERQYEYHFSNDLRWTEVRNPFGPARLRTQRSMNVARDGSTRTTILSPSSWPDHPRNGVRENWTYEVTGTAPNRTLTVTLVDTDTTETFDEGAYAAPTSGLTAEVRIFSAIADDPINRALCGSGWGTDTDQEAAWQFARGLSGVLPVGYDVVAGGNIGVWADSPEGQYSVVDVEGFDRFGGTHLTNQSNFIIRFTGTLTHDGGEMWFREGDDELDLYSPDSVEDILWVFAGPAVGSLSPTLEVHGFAFPFDDEEEMITAAAGDVDIEVMMVRCAMLIGNRDMAPMIAASNSGPWELIGAHPSQPVVNETLFPPAF